MLCIVDGFHSPRPRRSAVARHGEKDGGRRR